MKRKALSLAVALSSVAGLIVPVHGLAAQQTYPAYTAGTTYYQQDFSSFTPVYRENDVATPNSQGTTFEVINGELKATRTQTTKDSSDIKDLNLKLALGQTISTGKVAISADVKFSKVTEDGTTDQPYLTIGQLFNPLILNYQAKINNKGYDLTTKGLGWDEYHTFTVIADLDTKKETLYINGVRQTNVTNIDMNTDYASGISELLIKLPRADAKCIVYMDNILVQEVAGVDPLKNFDPCGDGSKYITGDLPSTVNVEGTDVPVTYSGDASGIVAADGTVTLPTNYTDITVTANAEWEGIPYSETLSLTATPAGATTLLNAGFGATPNASEQVFGSSAIDGWTATGAEGNDHASFGIGVPTVNATNAIHITRTASDSAKANYTLTSTSFAVPSNITVIRFSVYKLANKNMDLQLTPYVGRIKHYYNSGTPQLRILPRGSSEKTYNGVTMNNGWNDFMFVIDTSALKMDVYLNGTCLTASEQLTVGGTDALTAIGMTCQKNTSVATDVYVDDLLVQSLDTNTFYAINGVTTENAQVTKVNVSKYIGASSDPMLYVATFDSTGRMTGVTSQVLSNSALTGSSNDVTLTTPISVSSGETIASFIFSNDDSITPYAYAKRIEN